jgi:hypothetical protein
MSAYEINRKIMRVKWGLELSGDGCVIKLAFLYFFPTPLLYYFLPAWCWWTRDSLFVSCALARAKTRTITAWQMMWSETQHAIIIQNILFFPRASSYSEGIPWAKWQKETCENFSSRGPKKQRPLCVKTSHWSLQLCIREISLAAFLNASLKLLALDF